MSTVITWSADLFPSKLVSQSIKVNDPVNSWGGDNGRYNTLEELEQLERESVRNGTSGDVLNDQQSLVQEIRNFFEFIDDVSEHGLIYAIYGKTFPEVMADFFKNLWDYIWKAIISNGDLLFLIPAFIALAATFFVGRNKFTKWIIPLVIAYFMTRVFYNLEFN